MAPQSMCMPPWQAGHDVIPFSPICATVPQVFLNRVSYHNWDTWLEESLMRFPQVFYMLPDVLASKHRLCQKNIQQTKIKISFRKLIQEGIINTLQCKIMQSTSSKKKKAFVGKALLYQ